MDRPKITPQDSYEWKPRHGFGRGAPLIAPDDGGQPASAAAATRKQGGAELSRSLQRSKRTAAANQTQEATRLRVINWQAGRPQAVIAIEWRVIRQRQGGMSYAAIAAALEKPVAWVRETERSVLDHLRHQSRRPQRA